jgi:prolyl-tRNA editing enzyme YbaK/EbsC (Cys-tRNA(Pro) deacylase)
MKDALAIHRWLLAHQVHHEILPRSLSGADELPEVLDVAPESCVSVTVFEASYPFGSEPVAVIGSVAFPSRSAVVGAILGARKMHPAPAFLVNSATDYAAGLVCPLLLPEELTVLLDQGLIDVLKPDEGVYTPTGERCTALLLRAHDLLALARGKAIELHTRRRPLGLGGIAMPH